MYSRSYVKVQFAAGPEAGCSALEPAYALASLYEHKMSRVNDAIEVRGAQPELALILRADPQT